MDGPKQPEGAKQPLELVGNIHAPEVFASEASSFASGMGVVVITFASFRWDNADPAPGQKRVVIGRLVMPIAGAQGLAVGLYDYLVKHGLDPVPKPKEPNQIQ